MGLSAWAGRAKEGVAYLLRVRETTERIARAKTQTDLDALKLRFESPDGWLEPLCPVHRDNAALLDDLHEWRKDRSVAFPVQAPVSKQGSTIWFHESTSPQDGRILWLVMSEDAGPIGHIGLGSMAHVERSVEIENVVRGVADAPKGLMSNAVKALLKWCLGPLGATDVSLRVYESNRHAIEFYERLGFVAHERLALRRTERGEAIVYRSLSEDEADHADDALLTMIYEPKLADQ